MDAVRNAQLTLDATPPTSFLMCAPDHYTTSFVLNPWMDYRDADVDPGVALDQWTALKQAIERSGASVDLIGQAPESPPMVFTADCALVYGPGRALVLSNDGSRSYHEPRLAAAWLEEHGFQAESLPPAYHVDGGNLLRLSSSAYLVGLKPGSTGQAERYVATLLERVSGARTFPLALHDGRFLHLDMVVGNLAGRGLLIHWDGLHPAARRYLRAWAGDAIPLIPVGEADAKHFACNCVSLSTGRVVTGPISDSLAHEIEALGVGVTRLDLSEFYKAGGGAKCLTLPITYT